MEAVGAEKTACVTWNQKKGTGKEKTVPKLSPFPSRFRWRRKKKDYYKKEVKKQRILFPEMYPNLKWMDFAG